MAGTRVCHTGNKLRMFAIVAVIVLAIVAILAWPRLRIAYYEWGFYRARSAYSAPQTIQDDFGVVEVPNDVVDRYEYYRRKLVNVGALVERRYQLAHVWLHTPEGDYLSRLLVSGSCPSYVDFESPHSSKREPMELIIWCRPEDATAWDAFIRSHDVPH